MPDRWTLRHSISLRPDVLNMGKHGTCLVLSEGGEAKNTGITLALINLLSIVFNPRN